MAETPPDWVLAAEKLLGAFDELRRTTMAERIITGRSVKQLRDDSNAALADLRAAVAQYKKERGNAD